MAEEYGKTQWSVGMTNSTQGEQYEAELSGALESQATIGNPYTMQNPTPAQTFVGGRGGNQINGQWAIPGQPRVPVVQDPNAYYRNQPHYATGFYYTIQTPPQVGQPQVAPRINPQVAAPQANQQATPQVTQGGPAPATGGGGAAPPTQEGRPVCRYMTTGCRYGDDCRFLHTNAEPKAPTSPQLEDFDRPICRNIATPAGCRFGDDCIFLHPAGTKSPAQAGSEGATTQPGGAPGGGRTVSGAVCRYMATPSGCRFGTKCKFLHPGVNGPAPGSETGGFDDRPICRNIGSPAGCRYGDNCIFLHPDTNGPPL